jgi:predicted dehydrogenase
VAKRWKVGIVKDTSKPMFCLHALHVAFRGLPDVDVVAHCDSNPTDIAKKMSVTQAKRHYHDYREMLDRESLDIVVLCSRHPGDHFAQIRAAAERGCHIYCEKPLVADLREADEIARIANEKRVKIGVAHPARYSLPYLTMKKMIEDGEIGTPFTAYGRGKCDQRGGGEDMVVLGTHIFDLQIFLFGAPQRVWADVKANGHPISAADRVKPLEPIGPTAGDDIFACFNFPNGARGIFESRKGLPGVRDGIVQMGLTVVGSKGALAMRFNDAARPVCTLRINRNPTPPEDGAQFAEVPLCETRSIPGAEPLDLSLCGQTDIPPASFFLEAHRFAVWDLMRAIEADREPVSSVSNARTALEMVYGIYASSLTKKQIEFPLVSRRHPLES